MAAVTPTQPGSPSRPTRPIMVSVAAGLVAIYAVMFIAWDMIAPFERPYAEGPVSVVLGFRVFGLSARLAPGRVQRRLYAGLIRDMGTGL